MKISEKRLKKINARPGWSRGFLWPVCFEAMSKSGSLVSMVITFHEEKTRVDNALKASFAEERENKLEQNAELLEGEL